MHLKSMKFFIFALLLFNPFFSSPLSSSSHEDLDLRIHSLGSLVFHTQEWEEALNNNLLFPDSFIFSEEESQLLWTTLRKSLTGFDASEESVDTPLFLSAYNHYKEAQKSMDQLCLPEAQKQMKAAASILSTLWERAIDAEINALPSFSLLRKKNSQSFSENPLITHDIEKKISPYLLSSRHPMYEVLEKIFHQTRATQNVKTFHEAGFKTIARGPRSYIYVAKHEKLPGYLVKAHLDTEKREKRNKPSWEWFVSRCEGAKKVWMIIKKRGIKHFVVANKWIYVLPPEPSPPQDRRHTRHLALLLVTDMDLASDRMNFHAWSSLITREHLDELYAIISRAKGSSYRPDNISYTNGGKFAFIDTEYPTRGPDYKSIRPHLNHEMQRYWDKLVRGGGRA